MFLTSAASACYNPFLPVYFNDRKFSFNQMGIAFAISAIIGVAAQPVWGYISDKYLNKRKSIIIALVINMIIILSFIAAKSFGMIIVLIVINMIFMSGIAPPTDAYIYDIVEERGDINYSNIRFMASAAWGLSNLILGYFIRRYGINYTFILYDIAASAGLFVILGMKYEGKKSHNKIEVKDIKVLFKDAGLMLFFLTVFLMNAALIGGVNYMNELVRFNNGDVSKLGMVWFVTCTFEVLTFYVAVKLIKRYGILKIYFISILIYGFKFIIDFVLKNANYIIAFQALEGIAFTLFLTSSLEYLNRNTDANIRATAMSLYAAVGGFGAFTTSLLGGMLLNVINPSRLYGFFGILCFVSFVCATGLRNKREALDA
jgi:MFS family permease